MGAAGKVALLSFIRYLPPESELKREMNPKDEIGQWNSVQQTNILLADIFDAFSIVNTKKGRKPFEYPRPKKKAGIGKGAIPIKDFWEWWNEER